MTDKKKTEQPEKLTNEELQVTINILMQYQTSVKNAATVQRIAQKLQNLKQSE